MPALSSLPVLALSCAIISALWSSLIPALSCLSVFALSSFFLPVLLSSPILALSYLLLPTLLSSLMPVLLSPLIPTLSSLLMSAVSSRFVFGPALTYLISLALKTFKQVLLSEFLCYCSTSPSPVELLCLFPTLGSLPKKNNCKWSFNTALINSHLLTGNYAIEEISLSFGKCRYLALVKLNWI